MFKNITTFNLKETTIAKIMQIKFLYISAPIIIFAGFFYAGWDMRHHPPIASINEIKVGTEYQTFNASSSINDLYLWSPEERNGLLFVADMEKDYRVVVNATNDGIKNHKELIWDDIDFWIHRGVALFQLGDCSEATETFTHALTLDPHDETATDFMGLILSKQCGVDSEAEQMRKEFNKNTRNKK